MRVWSLSVRHPCLAACIPNPRQKYTSSISPARAHQRGRTDTDTITAYSSICRSEGTPHRCKILPPAFYTRLRQHTSDRRLSGYSQVARYTQGHDVFQYDTIFIPILLRSHWTGILINNRTSHIRYFDTAREGGGEQTLLVRRWLRQEWTRLHKGPPPTWRTQLSSSSNTPRQTNDHSSGIYIMLFMDAVCAGTDITRITPHDADNARWAVAQRLLAKAHTLHTSTGPPPTAFLHTISTADPVEHASPRSDQSPKLNSSAGILR